MRHIQINKQGGRRRSRLTQFECSLCNPPVALCNPPVAFCNPPVALCGPKGSACFSRSVPLHMPTLTIVVLTEPINMLLISLGRVRRPISETTRFLCCQSPPYSTLSMKIAAMWLYFYLFWITYATGMCDTTGTGIAQNVYKSSIATKLDSRDLFALPALSPSLRWVPDIDLITPQIIL